MRSLMFSSCREQMLGLPKMGIVNALEPVVLYAFMWIEHMQGSRTELPIVYPPENSHSYGNLQVILIFLVKLLIFH